MSDTVKTDIKHVAWHGKVWDAGIVSEYIQHGHIHTPLPSFCTAGVVCFLTQGQDFVECAFLIPKCAPVCNAQCTLRSVGFFSCIIFSTTVYCTQLPPLIWSCSARPTVVWANIRPEKPHTYTRRGRLGVNRAAYPSAKRRVFPGDREKLLENVRFSKTLCSHCPHPLLQPHSHHSKEGGESRMDMWENGTPPLMGCYGNHSRQSNL